MNRINLILFASLSFLFSVGASAMANTQLAVRPIDRTWGQSLAQQFDEVCGDSFCEGEFSNLRSLEIVCAVHSGSQVSSCIWNIAATNIDIDPVSGDLVTESKVYTCDLGISGSQNEVDEFFARAAQPGFYSEGLRKVVVPGSNASLYDRLVKCL